MKRIFVALACLTLCPVVSLAQKGSAESDYYPLGYTGDIWMGEVTAIDNERRTLTLTYSKGKEVLTFLASIPDAPYEWRRDGRKARVLDFPYDRQAKYQTFRYNGRRQGGYNSARGGRPIKPATEAKSAELKCNLRAFRLPGPADHSLLHG